MSDQPSLEFCQRDATSEHPKALLHATGLAGLHRPNPARALIVILPGLRTTQEMGETGVNSTANALIRRLGDDGALDADICMAVYAAHPNRAYTDGHFQQTNDPNTATSREELADAHTFVDKLLLPLMGVTAEGPPATAGAVKNLSRLTLVAHSFGTRFADEAAKIFHSRLIDLGYSEKDAAQLTREPVCLNLANAARLDSKSPSFRSIGFGNVNDSTVHGVATLAANGNEQQADLFYKAAGYDPKRTDKPNKRTPALTMRSTHTGVMIQSQLPPELHIDRHGKTDIINAESLQHEFEKSGPHRNVHGEPMPANDMVPQHDIRMYLTPTLATHGLSNKPMVDAVRHCLNAALTRPTSLPNLWRGDLNKMLPPSLGKGQSPA